MTLSKAPMVLATVATLAFSAPALAANQSTGAAGGGGGENPLSNDRGNDMLDVNPSFPTGCYAQGADGRAIEVACPSLPIEQSQPIDRH
jgi:hypothetical protein